jgi:hypothetical protein
MLGGYNMCSSGCSFEKTFTDLPPHSEVYVEVLYFSIDSWDHTDDWGLDHIQISLDNVPLTQCYPPAIGTNTSVRHTDASVCGLSWFMDLGPFRCTAHTPHIDSALTVRISFGANEGASEDMGILAVKLYIK